MKKILCILIVFIGASCSTSSKKLNESFDSFEIKKITENGVQSVAVNYQQQGWPSLRYKEGKSFNFVSKKIKIAVIGDTGCRLKESNGKKSYQKCNLISEWPYPVLTQQVAKEKYDFLIHTGDYHYREHCSEAECPTYTKSIGYGWDVWWEDFFKPTQVLFQKSPILFVRGNHEDCQRAYSGWNVLSASNKDFTESCQAVEPFQWVEMQDLVFINFDDSAFEDRKQLNSEDEKKWMDAFTSLAKRIENLNERKEIWFVAHKPVLGFVPDEDAEPKEITENLKKILFKSGLLSKIDFYLGGHIHNQQIILNQEHLTQVIVGNSGTALDPFGRKIMNSQVITTTESKNSFGYAIFERTGFKRWNWFFKNGQGVTELECRVNTVRTNCDFK